MSADSTQPDRPLHAIILAAGKGTRMNSDLPKVLLPVADRPMLDWVLDACTAVGCRRTVIVVGHQAQRVREAAAGRDGVEFVEQTEQLGTGHAVEQARAGFEGMDADVLVLCGDGPLIRSDTLRRLLQTHRDSGAAATLATAVIEDPTGYGRIVRDAEGRLEKIVEHKDADAAQLAIREINDAAALFDALSRIGNDNAKGEYYLTDVFALLRQDGRTVSVVDAVPAEDVLSINTPDQLAEVDAVLRRRAGQEVGR